MRRGLLKNLADTPTQIACGWRLYGDLPRLRELAGSEVTVDLLGGTAVANGAELAPTLYVAAEIFAWLSERVQQDRVPVGTIISAELKLVPRANTRGDLSVDCTTVLTTTRGEFSSRDTTRWAAGD